MLLYGVYWEVIAYTMLLCFTSVLAFLILRFIRLWNKHNDLQRLLLNIDALLGELPRSFSPLEDDYQELLVALNQARSHSATDFHTAQQEMSDYYSMWAHQIKTPIAAMSLMLQDMEDGTANKNELVAQLFSIEQYVDMVMHYVRMDSIHSDLAFAYFPIDKVIKAVVKKHARSFIYRKIALDYEKPDDRVLSDEKWLGFVIDQVLSNALKYTKTGKIRIYMNDSMTLVIEDTGIGIRPEDLPRVFERGYTGFNGRANSKSSGIGLFLCKEIMKRLGHSITIESTLNQGTKVFLHLSRKELNVSD